MPQIYVLESGSKSLLVCCASEIMRSPCPLCFAIRRIRRALTDVKGLERGLAAVDHSLWRSYPGFQVRLVKENLKLRVRKNQFDNL